MSDKGEGVPINYYETLYSILPSEIVRPGQEFDFFKNPPHIFDDDTTYESLDNRILLLNIGIKSLPYIMFTPWARGWKRLERYFTVTPFQPSRGYQISQDDFNSRTRIEKIEKGGQEIVDSTDLMAISLDADWNVFKDIGLTTTTTPYETKSGYFEFKPEVSRILKGLRLQVSFPTSSFASMPDDREFSMAALTFDNFYPIDTGPLAVPPEAEIKAAGLNPNHLKRGFALSVTPEQLKQIKAKFVFTGK